jgi:polysaccharide biosynthesis protein PslH
MKILWVCPTLLHPTINGSQIRTLGILRHLSRFNDIHFAGLSRQYQTTDGSHEYCSKVYSFVHEPPTRRSVRFAWQALGNFASDIPLYVDRYRSPRLLAQVRELLASNRYDAIVCDFLMSAPNVPRLEDVVLFQHNVESRIMGRQAEQASSAAEGAYLRHMAAKLDRYEGEVCRKVKHVITVSPSDSAYLEQRHGVAETSALPTGVNLEYFKRQPVTGQDKAFDLVFVGSLDYVPNSSGVTWFVEEVLPLIHRRRPNTTVALVGKYPGPAIRRYGEQDRRIHVTGTVPDVRPYLWAGGISIVPLFAGSGTRLKIYEAMAASLPVVSTTLGAEGLTYEDGRTIVIADSAEAFAQKCLELLDDPGRRRQIADAACKQVTESFDWEKVAIRFHDVLERTVGVPVGATRG